ncbi:Nuclear pore complex protein NUP50A [Hirschfeldia incana]|nr:Nuclear pore complex protein NUP50A [Hirschfeldia incana]
MNSNRKIGWIKIERDHFAHPAIGFVILLLLPVCDCLYSLKTIFYFQMGDSENAQPPSKKRGALKQLSRDNPGLDDDDDDASAEFESGTFKKASDEVLASRRIVRIKRKEPSAAPSAAATTNPFAGIQLLPTTAPVSTAFGTNPPLAESKLTPAEAVVEDNQKGTDAEEEGDEVESKKVDDVKDSAGEEETKDDNQCGKTADDQTTHADVDKTVQGTDQTEKESVVQGTDQTEKESGGGEQTEGKEKEGDGSVEAGDKNGDNNGSMTSFQQHSTSKNAFSGLATTDSSAPKFSFGDASGSPFGLGISNSNSPSLFGASITKKSEGSGFPSKEEVSVETGEEDENAAFSADSIMFEYLDGGWRERGKGEVKVNVSSNGGKARLVMRAKGNYRLILNASLYPEMKLASMDKKGITFACVNSVSEGKEGLSTFALKFKDPTIVEEFRVAVDNHKGSKPIETAPTLKTPENSPTATTEAA